MPTVLITGANRGLGHEFATQYAKDGWTVIATCRTQDELPVLRQIEGDVQAHQLDVSKQEQVDALANELSGTAIDVLIANAGMYGPKGSLQTMALDGWLDTFEVNAIGPVRLARAFLPHVTQSEQKKLVAITSKMGSIEDNGSGGSIAYRSSKAALNAAWKSVAIDTKDDGVLALLLHPGWVRTRMGGPNGLIDAEESINGMRKVIDRLDTANSGSFIDYKGEIVPW
jgi:NAD(P)-dependent dehydrogenase (short-subunit alcohol dehydrogenase family)